MSGPQWSGLSVVKWIADTQGSYPAPTERGGSSRSSLSDTAIAASGKLYPVNSWSRPKLSTVSSWSEVINHADGSIALAAIGGAVRTWTSVYVSSCGVTAGAGIGSGPSAARTPPPGCTRVGHHAQASWGSRQLVFQVVLTTIQWFARMRKWGAGGSHKSPPNDIQ